MITIHVNLLFLLLVFLVWVFRRPIFTFLYAAYFFFGIAFKGVFSLYKKDKK